MNVVLVEDSTLIAAQILDRLALRPTLRVVGHAVSEDDAVTLILASQTDAVVLDLSLKPGSGLSVIRRIREQGSQARILVLTNFTHPEMRNACIKAGVSHFFDKHTQADECIDALVGLGRAGAASPAPGPGPGTRQALGPQAP